MTTYSKYKDFTLRKKVHKNELNILILKSFLSNKKISKVMRFKIMLKMNRLYKGLLGNKYKNRCMYSTKIRAVNRMTNLTKSSFKDTLRWGNVSGFKKASW